MYQKIKDEIKDIISIVKDCPEQLQEKCFEIMLNHLLKEVSPPTYKSEKIQDPIHNQDSKPLPQQPNDDAQEEADEECEIELKDFHIKIRRFLESSGINCNDLNKIYYKEGSKVLPLYEDLGTNSVTDCQIRLCLLTAFEGSIENDGELVFYGEDVRKRCQELKCYDGANFTAVFKRYATLFDDFEKYEKTKLIKLSSEGKKELAKVLTLLSRGE